MKSFPEKARNVLACSTTELGGMECDQDENKNKLSELSLSEVMAVTDSERTGVSEVAPSTDPNDSLGEICEDLFASGMSETIQSETEKEALSEESLRLSGKSDSCMVENKSHENLHHGVFSDKQTGRQSKTSNSKDVVSLKTEKQGVETKTQNVENETSVSDMEDVMPKAGKQGAEIIVQTANTKEEFVSRNREQHGREMKLQTDKSKDTTSKDVVSKKADKKDGTEMQSVESQFSHEETSGYKQGENATRSEDLTKEQCCQVNFSLDGAKSDELKALTEKLAISKKDTETMKKLLEDVRRDYEDLQKSFEKREAEVKSRAFVEPVTKDDDEMEDEKARLNRKTSKKESRVLRTSDEKARPKSSERRKVGERNSFFTNSREKAVDSCDLTCPCFTQHLRKIVTDVTEDFKDAILVVKQSSLNQSESFGSEFATLKDEYRSSLERKDSEIHVLEETIRGLQARMREGERQAGDYRNVISTAFEEKKKLYDDIHGLKEELVKVQHENEINRADFEGIKHELKKYCTAEEYEELERLNFKFSDGKEVEGTPAPQSESCEDVTKLRNKVAKFYPVLKKAKKEMSKLKKEKKDIENRLQANISQAAEKEMHLSNKLNRALSDVKENDVKRAELTEKLEQLMDENAKLDVKVKKLEEQTEHLHSHHSLELRTANEKLKLSDASLRLHQAKYDELQEDYGRLRNGYNDLKKFLEDMSTRGRKKIVDDFFDNVGSTEHLLKVTL